MSEIIGVVGAGTMGNGIAQVAARAGYSVILHDVSEAFIERGMNAIDKSLQRDVEKERLDTETKQTIVKRINTTTDFAAFSNAALVIEAVTENLDGEDRSLQDSRSGHTTTRDTRLKHFINFNHQTGRRNKTP